MRNSTIWPDMDPADRDTVSHVLNSQAQQIQAHENQLKAIATGVQQITERQDRAQQEVSAQVSQLGAQLQRIASRLDQLTPLQQTTPATPPSVSSPSPAIYLPRPARLAPPEKYSRESGQCRSFLVQCDLHFQNDPAAFASDQAQVAFIISHLSGRAAAWATQEWARGAAVCQNKQQFTHLLTRLIDHCCSSQEASRAMFELRQNSRRVMDYAIEFRTRATDSGWNSPALKGAFINGLDDDVKDQLAPHEIPEEFEDLVKLAIRIDTRLQEREGERRRATRRSSELQGVPSLRREFWRSSVFSSSTAVRTPSSDLAEPMQLGRARLDPEERRRRVRVGACFYCGQAGHQLDSCPAKEGAHQASQEVKRRGRLGWGFSSHYRCHIDPGHTFRWTSSHGSASIKSLSSGYHPESNGQTERLNQELETLPEMSGGAEPDDLERPPHLPRSLRVHPTFHVSKIKPVRESHLVPPSKPPPPPKMVEGGPVYAVKKLLAVRKRGRGRQFLVDWEGYGPEERSWIPASFIVCKKLIEDFYRQHPETRQDRQESVLRGGGTVMSRQI
ncbi:hypothetical protein L3Q82_005509 [Scortum barcoo]|uniref:Uncharacterized protein n=1 Tax=Scortum barcoo TaxID=214431 RepID=A0ACB8VBF0_9TELE|nr:hypothetical protein L3Q82_005509 [Scortum barcoo]